MSQTHTWFHHVFNGEAEATCPGGRMLDRVPTTTYLMACGWELVYAPNTGYSLDEDTDGDGIDDTNSWLYSVSTGFQYNALAAVHNKGANSLFPDGRVEWVSLLDWINNKDEMWGTQVRP